MNWWQQFDIWLENFLVNFIPDPETDPKTLPMNAPDEPIPSQPLKMSASEQLRATAKLWLGKDASPNNLEKSEVACAETVVFLVNQTWPGTLDIKIVGTDALDTALRRCKRFKPVLDPIPGTIEVSPRTPSVNGHTGIYVEADSIASNNSITGHFNENYTRQSWRDTFIKGRGLKAHLFTPVDI